MTKTDISEAFALFKLVFPTASVFTGASAEEQRDNLNTLISLWERSTAKIDRWLGLSAAEYIVQHNKFFPNIAEFHEAAAAVQGICSGEVSEAFSYLKMLHAFYLYDIYTQEQLIGYLPTRTKRVLKSMGGFDVFYKDGRYNYNDFFRIYNEMLRTNQCYIPRTEIKTMAIPQIEGRQNDLQI